MKATAFLMNGGTIMVLKDGSEQPAGALRSLTVDAGISDDWNFIVRLAEQAMGNKYAMFGSGAYDISPHCKMKTIRVDGKRFNLDGEPHECTAKIIRVKK